jgi:uncharacterized protein (DUF58 family)
LPAITPEGQVIAFLLMSASSLLMIFPHPVFYLALAIGMAFLGVGFLYPYLNLLQLSFRRSMPLSAYAGETIPIELAVACRRRHTDCFALVLGDDPIEGREVAIHIPYLSAGQVQRVGYTATYPRRGRYRLRYIRVSSGFPFFLFSRTLLIRYTSEITIYPRPYLMRRRLIPLPHGHLASRPRLMRGGESFHGLREYRHGEDSRLIHWRSSVRRMTPLVREFDLEAGDRVLVALDPRFSGTPARWQSFERAISSCLTVADSLWRQGHQVHVALHGTQPRIVRLAGYPRAGYRILLDELATYTSRGDHSLSDLLAEVRHVDYRRCVFVLITGRDGTSYAELRRQWRGGGRIVYLDVDAPSFDDLFFDQPGRVVR